MNEAIRVLKQDVQGRVRVPAERREALLDEFERTGVSGAKFAEMVGVKYSTFAAWIALRKRRHLSLTPRPASAGSLRLVEAVVGSESGPRTSSGAALQLHLGGGVRLEISEERQLKWALALVKLLKAQRPC